MDRRDMMIREMVQKIEEMRYELEMMKLQQEIDALQREIDESASRLPHTSTPYADGRPTMTFDRPSSRSCQTEVKHEPGLTPLPMMTKMRPRRLLPKTPGVCSCCKGTVTGDLEAHVKLCPMRRPCHLCRKTFLRSRYLKKHMRETHKKCSPVIPQNTGTNTDDRDQDAWDKGPKLEIEVEYIDKTSVKTVDGEASQEGDTGRKRNDDLMNERRFEENILAMGKGVPTGKRLGSSDVTGRKKYGDDTPGERKFKMARDWDEDDRRDSGNSREDKMAIECHGDVELNIVNTVGNESLVATKIEVDSRIDI